MDRVIMPLSNWMNIEPSNNSESSSMSVPDGRLRFSLLEILILTTVCAVFVWLVRMLGVGNVLFWSVIVFSVSATLFVVVAKNSITRGTWLLLIPLVSVCVVPAAMWTYLIFAMNALMLFFTFTGLAAFHRTTARRVIMCGAVSTALTLLIAAHAGFFVEGF